MADYEYPPLQLYLPLDFDLSLLISSHPIFPPYPQGFTGAAGYGCPMMPTALPLEFDLALLTSAYNPYRRVASYACFPQSYAYHYLPPPPPQMNVFLETPAACVAQLQAYYLQQPQQEVYGLVRQGTGVFHPPVTSNNTTTPRRRRRRGRRRRRHRKRKQEESLSKKYTESSSQGKEKH